MPPLSFIALGAAVLLVFGYRFYGRRLNDIFGLVSDRPTPAVRREDGEDFVPTPPGMLLGQHFAAIAAVGPIAGPILAATQYGWLAGLAWIVFGSIFIGAVHDAAALAASVRHDGRSIGDLMKDHLGRAPSLVFSAYIWLSLSYVIVVFTDLTASAFVHRPSLGAENFGPGVATSSLLYLGLSIALGFALARGRMSLGRATALFLPLVFVAIWAGQKMPIVFPDDELAQQRMWDGVILVYCFFASVIPMWVLLQPRGYLGGFILYATFAVGILGIIFGGAPVSFPAGAAGFAALGHEHASLPVFPLLFTTIACGACSGFHGLVASGTTSKQLRRETDVPLVGYGGMLLEGLLAVIALGTVMMVSPGAAVLSHGPDEVYARGLAHFMQVFGIPLAAGVTFGKLAFATFIYDTLDVSTRLGRYVLEEMTGLRGRVGAVMATLGTLVIPAVSVFITFHGPDGAPLPLWKVFWPAFGASNQLLAALTLAGVTVWLKKEGRNYWVTGVPAVFMTVMSVASLCSIVGRRLGGASGWGDPVGWTAVALLLLAAGYLGAVAWRLPRVGVSAPQRVA